MANNTVAFYTIYIYFIIAIISRKVTNYVFGSKGLFVYVTREKP